MSKYVSECLKESGIADFNKTWTQAWLIIAVFLMMPLVFTSRAAAQCASFPYQLTNGQTADATQVMADFNALANCATTTSGTVTPGSIAVFSETNAIASGNLTGDVTTSGGTATTLAPSGITAGTYTNATVTVDAKGRVVAATSGGGGGSDYFDGLALPAPSVGDFTVTADSSFGSNYGLQQAATGVSLYGVDTNAFAFAWADKSIAGGAGTTGDFAVTALIKLAYLNSGSYAIGITLGDGTKRITWGFRNTVLWVSHTSGTNGSDSIQTFGGDIGAISSPTLFRIRKTGATIYEEIALDGKNFDIINSEAATGYLAANLTTYGIGILPSSTYQRIVLYGITGQ